MSLPIDWPLIAFMVSSAIMLIFGMEVWKSIEAQRNGRK